MHLIDNNVLEQKKIGGSNPHMLVDRFKGMDRPFKNNNNTFQHYYWWPFFLIYELTIQNMINDLLTVRIFKMCG